MIIICVYNEKFTPQMQCGWRDSNPHVTQTWDFKSHAATFSPHPRIFLFYYDAFIN